MPTDWVQDVQTQAAKTREQGGGASGVSRSKLRESALKRAKQAKTRGQDTTDADVEDTKREAQEKADKWRSLQEKTEADAFAEGMTTPAELFGQPKKMTKEDGGGGMGTVAVASDPGVFTETYGARKRKVMNRSNPQTKKSSKSGPEKLDDFLQNTFKSLDDESFLIELMNHVRQDLHLEDTLLKAGEGPHGTYTPYNERPYQPPFPHETKRKGRNDKISQYPTTENTVPVNTGAGELGQSKVPQETVMAGVGVDDARNMNRSIERKQKRKRMPTVQSGVFLNPGNESGNNYQDTAVAFTAMQKIGTHGNVTANTPKQFSTEKPQEPYIERKPRLDPNSDVEQKEFEGNVKSIDDEDKAKKGRPYTTNKESNNISSTNITQYSVHGGSPLQLSSTNMPVGLDSLKRDSDDAITEPDEENTEELQEKRERELPNDKDIIHAEKSAIQKMRDWFNEMS